MCWIEIPNRAIADEVQARLDADPRAIAFPVSAGRTKGGWALLLAAFTLGVAIGWLWRFQSRPSPPTTPASWEAWAMEKQSGTAAD